MGHKMNKSIVTLTLISIVSSGCSILQKKEKDIPEETPTITVEETVGLDYSRIEEELIGAAKKSSDALSIMAEVNNGIKRKEMTRNQIIQTEWNATYVPDNMGQRIDLYWNSGPFMAVVETLANASGYNIEVANPEMEPFNQPLVTIDTDQEYYKNGESYRKNRIIDVLRTVAYQVHPLGVNIDLIENKNMIIIRYNNLGDNVIRVENGTN